MAGVKQSGTSQSTSWLLLEQYHLGELPPEQHAHVERNLRESSTDRACLDQIIENDKQDLPPLPRLPDRATSRSWLLPLRKRRWFAPSLGVGFSAATVVIALLVARLSVEDSSGVELPGIKGGEVSMMLIRERNGVVEEEVQTFAPTDRFKVLVTCSSANPLWWRVAVFQADGVAYPMFAVSPIACGNRVLLPGAFHVRGDSPVVICIVMAEEPGELEQIETSAAHDLPDDSRCTAVIPVVVP
jgi:hypothetical protein